jgi:hypothetical protein
MQNKKSRAEIKPQKDLSQTGNMNLIKTKNDNLLSNIVGNSLQTMTLQKTAIDEIFDKHFANSDSSISSFSMSSHLRPEKRLKKSAEKFAKAKLEMANEQAMAKGFREDAKRAERKVPSGGGVKGVESRKTGKLMKISESRSRSRSFSREFMIEEKPDLARKPKKDHRKVDTEIMMIESDSKSRETDAFKGDKNQNYSGFGRKGAGPQRRGKPTFNKFQGMAAASNKMFMGEPQDDPNRDPLLRGKMPMAGQYPGRRIGGPFGDPNDAYKNMDLSNLIPKSGGKSEYSHDESDQKYFTGFDPINKKKKSSVGKDRWAGKTGSDLYKTGRKASEEVFFAKEKFGKGFGVGGLNKKKSGFKKKELK